MAMKRGGRDRCRRSRRTHRHLYLLLLTIAVYVYRYPASCFTFRKKLITSPILRMRSRKTVAVMYGSSLPRRSDDGSLSALTGRMRKLYNQYLLLLDEKPWTTQAISAGAISVLGDVLSQLVEAKVARVAFAIDPVRLHAFFWTGALYVGPFLHLWFQSLWRVGRWIKGRYGWSETSWQTTLLQTMVDQTIGVLLFFPTYFYAYEFCEALVSGRAPLLAEAHAKCREQIISVLLMQYRVWPAAQWMIFTFVKEDLRVLASNVVAVFWNAFLCTVVA